MEEKIKEAIDFLDIYKEELDAAKIKEGKFLRTAIVSHLTWLFRCKRHEAHLMLNAWIKKHTKDKIQKFKKDAVADGWSIERNYKNEPEDRAARLTKDGFVMIIFLREKDESITAWGPDGLQIIPIPEKYSMEKLKELLTFCPVCGKSGVETTRYSFAGRCCLECLPAMQKKHEFPGWTN